MAHPTWLGYTFATIMIGVGAYCLARLIAVKPMGRQSHYGVNVGHVLMAVAMVGMLVPRWAVLPIWLWEVAFGVMALWFGGLAARVVATHGVASIANGSGLHFRHYLIHSMMACAMLYMYWLGMPMTMHGGVMTMSGASLSSGDPGLTLFLVLVLLGSVVWQLNGMERLVPVQRTALVTAGLSGGGGTASSLGVAGDERLWLAPRLEVGCHIAMCIAMAYMLVLVV